jgi:hypothetical protein
VVLRRRSRQREDESFPGFTDVVRIGAGGFSTVFSAREVETNRQVALKILNVFDVSEHALGSFQRETFALGTLSAHPNIVTLYRTLTTEDERPVLVLELCHGSIWERTRGQWRMAPWESVAVTVKIAGALETAHRAGMLHRDIKPENLLITQYGEPALADFGVARLQSTSQATAGVFGFTTIHAAPELLEGRDLSAATDVYGLASTLYQLLAGKAAFRSFEDEGPASVILRILRDPVQPLVAEGVPVSLSDLLVGSMSKNPYDRPATALELADELRSIEAATGWPDTPYAIEEAAVLERRAPARPGRFQVRGVDAPTSDSVDAEPKHPARPVSVEPFAPIAIASEPEETAAWSEPAEFAEVAEPAAAAAVARGWSEPADSVSSRYAPDPASETVFVRTGPGRVEVPRGERHVLTPRGRPATATPAPIRPLSPLPTPTPPAPIPQPSSPAVPPPPPPPPAAAPPPAPAPAAPVPAAESSIPPVGVDSSLPAVPEESSIPPVPEESSPTLPAPPLPVRPATPPPTAEAPPPAPPPPPAASFPPLVLPPPPRPEPEPVLVEPIHNANPIEVVFPLGPSDPLGTFRSEPVDIEQEQDPEPEPDSVVVGPEPELEYAPREALAVPTATAEPGRTALADAEQAEALIEIEPEPEWAPEPEPEHSERPGPGPTQIEPEHSERPGPGPTQIEPIEPLDHPAVTVVPTPRFDHIFDEGEERSAPTIRPLTPPIGATTAAIPASWARPRFLSQTFSLEDDSNERRTRPTPVVKRATPAPPVPLRENPKTRGDAERGGGPAWSGDPGADEFQGTDETEDAQPRKGRRRHKRR